MLCVPLPGTGEPLSCLFTLRKVDALSCPCVSHSIRHGVVAHLLRQGVPVHKVGKIVGHSSEKITERYSHFIPDDLEDAMSLLE